MTDNSIISSRSIRNLLPRRYVKPIREVLESETAPQEVKNLSDATIKDVVLNEREDSPLWPYVLIYAKKVKSLRVKNQKTKKNLIKEV